jgi:hypothetical protein
VRPSHIHRRLCLAGIGYAAQNADAEDIHHHRRGNEGNTFKVRARRAWPEGGKALVIFGGFHLFRPQFPKAVAGTGRPGRVFVVGTMGGPGPAYDKFEKALRSQQRPVLVSLRGTPEAAFTLNQFSWGARRFVQGKGVPLFAPNLTLGDREDACVYFGQAADAADPDPDPAIYRGTPYGAEVARRRQILDARR